MCGMRPHLAIASLTACLSFASYCALAEPGTAAQACRTAEVNPVTGHVLCIDPLGAEVAPPPAADPCKTTALSHADWTWRPNCKAQDVTPAKESGAQG